MTCSNEFSLEIRPGVDFDELIWGTATHLDANSGSSDFTPENTGSNTWQASATAPSTTDIGRLTIDGTLIYTGPNRNCMATMTVSTNGVSTETGTTEVSLFYFLNSILQTSVSAADTSGIVQLPFTAQAGTMVLRFSIRSSLPSGSINQPKPMVISCDGVLASL